MSRETCPKYKKSMLAVQAFGCVETFLIGDLSKISKSKADRSKASKSKANKLGESCGFRQAGWQGEIGWLRDIGKFTGMVPERS